MTFRGGRTEGWFLKRAKSCLGLLSGRLPVLGRGLSGVGLLGLLAGLGGGLEALGGGGTQVYGAELADAVNVG